MVDTEDLKSSGESRAGSSPAPGTNFINAATAAAGNAVPVPGLGVALERKFKEKNSQLQQLPSKS